MESVMDKRQWIDYSGGQVMDAEYDSVVYTNVRGSRIEVPAEDDLLAQIMEIYRTCGKGTPIRLFLKETV